MTKVMDFYSEELSSKANRDEAEAFHFNVDDVLSAKTEVNVERLNKLDGVSKIAVNDSFKSKVIQLLKRKKIANNDFDLAIEFNVYYSKGNGDSPWILVTHAKQATASYASSRKTINDILRNEVSEVATLVVNDVSAYIQFPHIADPKSRKRGKEIHSNFSIVYPLGSKLLPVACEVRCVDKEALNDIANEISMMLETMIYKPSHIRPVLKSVPPSYIEKKDGHATANNDKATLADVLSPSVLEPNMNLEFEHPAIAKAVRFMLENHQENFKFSEMAKNAFVSPSHLSFLLKKRFNRTFKQLLTEIRLEKARHLFQEFPDRKITQVCCEVGFFDLSHFEKSFKKREGVCPRSYRDQFRKGICA